MVNSTMAFSSISTPTSYPESNKCYLQGSRPDLRVPYREVFLSATHHHSYIEDNRRSRFMTHLDRIRTRRLELTSIADFLFCATPGSRNETIPRSSTDERPNTPVGGKVICSPRICVFPGSTSLAERKAAGT
jgi:hypothetical protein